MPDTAYTPTARLAAGDPAMRDGPPSNAPLEREALDARRYARGATWAQFVWSGQVTVAGTASSPVITVGIIEAITLCTGNGTSTGEWRPYFTSAPAVLGISDVEGAPGSLSNSTRYFVYAWSDAGSVVKWQITTSPPTESGTPTVLRLWKRAQTANYRYVATFVTDGSGNPIPGSLCNGRYSYRGGATTDTIRALNNGVATSWATVSLAGFVPVTARRVYLWIQARRDAAAAAALTVEVRAVGDTAASATTSAPSVGTSDTSNDAIVPVDLDGTQAVEYQTIGGGAVAAGYGARIFVVGWEEAK